MHHVSSIHIFANNIHFVYFAMRRIDAENLKVGDHCVISRTNVSDYGTEVIITNASNINKIYFATADHTPLRGCHRGKYRYKSVGYLPYRDLKSLNPLPIKGESSNLKKERKRTQIRRQKELESAQKMAQHMAEKRAKEQEVFERARWSRRVKIEPKMGVCSYCQQEKMVIEIHFGMGVLRHYDLNSRTERICYDCYRPLHEALFQHEFASFSRRYEKARQKTKEANIRTHEARERAKTFIKEIKILRGELKELRVMVSEAKLETLSTRMAEVGIHGRYNGLKKKYDALVKKIEKYEKENTDRFMPAKGSDWEDW